MRARPLNITLIAALGLVACGGGVDQSREAPAGPDDGWTRPPTISAATVEKGALIVSGLAEPGGRVVLRSEPGAVYGSAANPDGRFQIRLPLTSETLFFRAETQVGQHAAASPDRLLVVDGGRGPIAVLRAGAASRRLHGTPSLGAVDTDGRVVIASGFAPGPALVSAAGEEQRVTPDPTGHWGAIVDLNPTGGEISVGSSRWSWPGAGQPSATEAPLAAARAGEGWRVHWESSPGVRQSTWLPDRG